MTCFAEKVIFSGAEVREAELAKAEDVVDSNGVGFRQSRICAYNLLFDEKDCLYKRQNALLAVSAALVAYWPTKRPSTVSS